MTAARARFAAAAAACFAWAGVVAWLGWTTANPVLVSAAQVAAADAVALGRVSADGARLEVSSVRWARAGMLPAALPKTVALAGAALPPTAAGQLLWAPAAMRPGGWEVAPLPQEPPVQFAAGLPRRPLYPDTPGVAKQFDAFLPAAKP